MHVNESSGEAARINGVQRATPAPAAAPAAPADQAPAQPRGDEVTISDVGRALASADVPAADGALDPQRADEIRARILSGAYNSLSMADQVARALLRSGDI